MIDTVIVSGGNIQNGFALDFLEKMIKRAGRKKLRFLAADRGLDFFINTGIVPDYAVGDFDSLSEEGKTYLTGHPEIKVKKLKPQKDDSDTQSALGLAAEKGARGVLLLGALGTRLDHVLANVELLLLGKEMGIPVVILDEYNYICLVKSGTVIKKKAQFGKYISFFPLGGDVRGLTLEGFMYPLDRHYLSALDCGLTVSNELQEESGKITFETGDLMMIQSRD